MERSPWAFIFSQLPALLSMPSSPPTALGGSLFIFHDLKQETHGTQSMGFYFPPTPNPLFNAPKPTHCAGWGCLLLLVFQDSPHLRRMTKDAAQSISFRASTKKNTGLIAQAGGSIIFTTTYLRLFLISSSTVEI